MAKVLVLLAILGAPVTGHYSRALFEEVKDRLNLPLCAGPNDATCVVNRARKILEHEGFLSDTVQQHAPEHVGMLRSLLTLPRFVATGAFDGVSSHSAHRKLADNKDAYVQNPYGAFLTDPGVNYANTTCEGRYKDLSEAIYMRGKGCHGGMDSTSNPSPAPAPEGGGGDDDSCATSDEGTSLGDTLYFEYTCSYDLQPLACQADNDAVCHTDSPQSDRDGWWSEYLFENDDCKLPEDPQYNEEDSKVGGENGCDHKWNTQKPQRHSEKVKDHEQMCPDFAKRAWKDGITARGGTAVETCAEAADRANRREEPKDDSNGAVIGGAIAGVLVLGLAGVLCSRSKRRQANQQQSQQPQMTVAQPQIAVAQAAQQQIDVQIPPGYAPGSTMLVAAPSGQQFSILVPEGAGPGTTIRVPIPAPTATAIATNSGQKTTM